MSRRRISRSALTWTLFMIAAPFAQTPQPAVTGSQFVHTVRSGEALIDVGARFGIEPHVLAGLNSLKVNAPLIAGQTLVVDSRHIVPVRSGGQLLINLPQRMLFLFGPTDAVRGYPIAVGRRDWPTFTGAFAVNVLEVDPIWDVPPSIQREQRLAGKPVLEHVPPGPANPLGKYWIGLDRAGFGIHGTSAPRSIYHFQTHGCIRLHPDDVRIVFEALAIGAQGTIVYEPVLLAVMADGILLEAHPDVYRRQPDAMKQLRAMADTRDIGTQIDWKAAAAVLQRREGMPTDVSISRSRSQGR